VSGAKVARGGAIDRGKAVRIKQPEAVWNEATILAQEKEALQPVPAPTSILIEVAPGFLEQMATRDDAGNRLHVDLGEPDARGIYSPTITVDATDNIVERALAAFQRKLEERQPQPTVQQTAQDLGLPGMRMVHILRKRDIGQEFDRWMPVKSWAIWGGADALEWDDSRWNEQNGFGEPTFPDDNYQLKVGDVTIPFRIIRDGQGVVRAYREDGQQLRIG